MPQGFSRSELKDMGVSNSLNLTWLGPLELYGIFVEVAKQAFSDSGFSKRRWDPDEMKSGLYIVPEYLWDDKTVEKRPAIYVTLGDISCDPYASAFSEAGSMGINMQGEQGIEHDYADVKTGSVSWHVVAETRGEALDILGELARYLNMFQSRIQADFCFKSFAVSQISPLQIVKEARERLQCSVSASFRYEQAWQLVEEAPKARIDLKLAVPGM